MSTLEKMITVLSLTGSLQSRRAPVNGGDEGREPQHRPANRTLRREKRWAIIAPMETQPSTDERVLAANFPRNAAAATLFDLLWGLGMPFCTMMAVVPLYLFHLGSSKLLVQCVVVALQLLTFAQLWSGRVCSGPRRKLRNLGIWVVFTLVWALYGSAALWFWDLLPVTAWIGIFALTVMCMGLLVHLAMPTFGEVMLENIPKRRRGLVVAIRRAALGFAGIVGVIFTRRIMTAWDGPTNFHIRFIIGAALFLIACSAYLFMKDAAASNRLVGDGDRAVLAPVKKLFANINFRTFLVFQMLLRAAASLMPLMLAYGGDVLKLTPQESEFFIMAFFIGMLAVGLSVPLLADRFGFRAIAIINSVLMILAFAIPVVAGRSATAAFVAYGCYAGSVGLTMTVMANLGAELVPGVRPATIIAVGGTLAMPLSLAMAPVGGWLVDTYKEAGYLCVFVVGATLSLCALVGFVLLVREPRSGQELFVRIRKI